MTTAGIICEFNPFHNGHARLISKARERGADRVIALMSGDYVQRGEPAAFSRWVRTKMALLGGADVVLALPSRYASSSAEQFAGAGVDILNRLGCVDILFFGSESGDINALLACARKLADEDEGYRELLRAGLKRGISYPKARAEALPEYRSLLASPNNILGIEYLKALLRNGSQIRPMTLKREGAGYHDCVGGALPSAKAVREAYLSGSLEELQKMLPESVYGVICAEPGNGDMMQADDFSVLLASAISRAGGAERLSRYLDVTPDLASTVWSMREQFVSFSSFVKICASKSLTLSHVSRAFLHIALGMEKTQEYAPVTQVLGFRKEAQDLVGQIQKEARIPVIMNPARETDALSGRERELYEEEMRVSDLYQMMKAVRYGKTWRSEMREPIVKL